MCLDSIALLGNSLRGRCLSHVGREGNRRLASQLRRAELLGSVSETVSPTGPFPLWYPAGPRKYTDSHHFFLPDAPDFLEDRWFLTTEPAGADAEWRSRPTRVCSPQNC